MENDEKKVRIADALMTVERKLAFARDYQSANVVQAAIIYIEQLEKNAEPEEVAAEEVEVETVE